MQAARIAIRHLQPQVRALSVSTQAQQKVAVLGGAGGIGQPLSLLLKNSPYVTELSVFDVAHAKGVAADLSHVSTQAEVKGYVGMNEIEGALKGCKVVVVPAGVPRKPGMTRDDLFNINASIVRDLTGAVAKYCPDAFLLIISNPVNSTVPIAAEVLKKAGVYDARKLFGVTTLDIVRARTFIGGAKGVKILDVPVIGGHAGVTILPLLSRVSPQVTFTDAERDALTDRIQNGGTEVVEAKAGTGSATLSMAAAGYEMTEAVLRARAGEKGITVCAYVESSETAASFFATPVVLDENGVAKNLGLGTLNAYEADKLKREVIPELLGSIKKGVAFVKSA